MGDTILQQRGFENTDAWIWVGVPFMIGAIIVLNIAIIFCLAVLDCEFLRPFRLHPPQLCPSLFHDLFTAHQGQHGRRHKGSTSLTKRNIFLNMISV